MAHVLDQPLTLPLTFSPSAIAALKHILATETIGPGQGLRVGVKGGGCSGMSYVLGIDDPSSFDEVHQIDGIQLMLDKRHLLYLINMHVDYSDGLNARGFVFQNPNAKTTCGCGTSFGV
jgi:iron-sulfur cluster assembly protein